MRVYKIFALVGLASGLTACSGGGSSLSSQPITSAPAPVEKFSTLNGSKSFQLHTSTLSAFGATGQVSAPSSNATTTVTASNGAVSSVDFAVARDGVTFNDTFTASDTAGPAYVSSDYTVYQKTNKQVAFYTPANAVDQFDYVRFGAWDQIIGADVSAGAFAGGYETAVADMPTSGTAAYTGKTFGGGTVTNGASGGLISFAGDMQASVDFGAKTLNGTFSAFSAAAIDRTTGNGLSLSFTINPTVSFSGNISGIGFSGTTNITSGGTGAGAISGGFYGPAAQEIGGAWNISGIISGYNVEMIGAFAGKH